MNRQVYRHLWQLYGRLPGVWIGAIAELIRSVLSQVVLGLVLATITSDIATGKLSSARLQIVLFLITTITALAVGSVGELFAFHAEDHRYGDYLTGRHFTKLTGKDMAFFKDNQTGYLATSFRQYLDSAVKLIRFFRIDVVRSTVSLLAPVIVLVAVDKRIGLVALGVVAIQLVYIVWASAKANQYREASHEVYRKISGEVSDAITNIVAYKSAGQEGAALRRITDLAKEETHVFWLRRAVGLVLEAPRVVTTALGMALAFWFVASGSGGVASSVSLTVLTLTYMIQILRTLDSLPALIMSHDDLVTQIYPTLAYLGNTYETILDKPSPEHFKPSGGHIDIGHIAFAYHSISGRKTEVFSDFSLTIPAGQRIGVVGLSGAGKSTLASLLMRFDEVEAGVIKIDGTDIRDVAQSELRRHIAFVPQEPLLFHRSIRENIKYFNDQASDEQMVQAAKAAHAHDFITGLPDGYDTLVGERGVKLSGGQKQRVVIARAILKNAQIMIFDEATSALDSESEKIVQNALPAIIGKHTAIVIAHRLSTVAGLDRIIVMHSGRVIEDGTHTQLLKQRGRYYSLWKKQTAGAEE